MTDPGLPFRLVRHDLPDGTHHFDLFIQSPRAEALATYELQTPLPGTHRVWIQLKQGEDRPGATLCVRKADHRLRYWDYTGEIEGNRGRISEVLRGFLENFRPEPEIRIMAEQ